MLHALEVELAPWYTQENRTAYKKHWDDGKDFKALGFSYYLSIRDIKELYRSMYSIIVFYEKGQYLGSVSVSDYYKESN